MSEMTLEELNDLAANIREMKAIAPYTTSIEGAILLACARIAEQDAEINRLKRVNDNAVARMAFLGIALGQAVELANIRVELRPKAGDEEGEGTEYVYCDSCGTPFMSTLAAYLREREVAE